jgi:integrase
MAMPLENVVAFNQGTVNEDIQIFLETRESISTKRSYEKAIKDFFIYLRNKAIADLNEEDLVFKHKDILRYQNHLKRKYKAKTVNARINSIRSLFKFLAKNEYNVNTIVFEVKSVSENDSETIGFFDSYNEAMLMVAKAKELPRGEMKSVLFDLGTHTSVRLSALLNLRLRDFESIDDEKYLVRAIDKQNEVQEKAITKELYERIEYISKDKKRNESIFDITSRQISNDIVKLVEMMEIGKDRNISFHSFRKVAAMYEITENNDLVAAARALGHSSIQTTYEYYVKYNRDYNSEASITMGKEENIDNVEKLDRDQLISIIKKSSKYNKRELDKLAGELLKTSN